MGKNKGSQNLVWKNKGSQNFDLFWRKHSGRVFPIKNDRPLIGGEMLGSKNNVHWTLPVAVVEYWVPQPPSTHLFIRGSAFSLDYFFKKAVILKFYKSPLVSLIHFNGELSYIWSLESNDKLYLLKAFLIFSHIIYTFWYIIIQHEM